MGNMINDPPIQSNRNFGSLLIYDCWFAKDVREYSPNCENKILTSKISNILTRYLVGRPWSKVALKKGRFQRNRPHPRQISNILAEPLHAQQFYHFRRWYPFLYPSIRVVPLPTCAGNLRRTASRFSYHHDGVLFSISYIGIIKHYFIYDFGQVFVGL